MKLFFDTETTDKADFHAPCDAPHQPRIVQLAAVLTDAEGRERGSMAMIIKPQGWRISHEAQAVHGVSLEDCERFGVPIVVALAAFSNLARVAEELIAFNVDFDRLLLEGECRRCARSLPPTVHYRCEMKAMTPVCAIPKPSQYRQANDPYKWPSLSEAHIFALGTDFKDKHDALGDVRALMAVHFWRLRQQSPAPKQEELVR
jgi:DNA polymerase-3 subunit epsilon